MGLTLLQSVAHIFLNYTVGKNEKTEVGTEVGKGVIKNLTQVWPYLCGLLCNSFPNLPPLHDRHVY